MFVLYAVVLKTRKLISSVRQLLKSNCMYISDENNQ